MTTLDQRPTAQTSTALRGTAFAAIVLLLIEFGIGVNLFGTVPDAATGKSAFAAFATVFGTGPVALATHAAVGTLLVLSAVTALVRAVLARHGAGVTLAAIALLAVIGAWFAGSAYVGDQSSGAARGMAYATALAILCYAAILLVVPGRRVDSAPPAA